MGSEVCDRDRRDIQRASLISTHWVPEGLFHSRAVFENTSTKNYHSGKSDHSYTPSPLLPPLLIFFTILSLWISGLLASPEKKSWQWSSAVVDCKDSRVGNLVLTQGCRDRPHWEGCKLRELRASAMNKAFCSQLMSYHFVIFNLDKELSRVLCVCFVSSTGLLLELLF